MLCSSPRGVTVCSSPPVVSYIQATEEDGSDEEDLDDDAMMELDKGLSVLFSEQKKKSQAKKDQKTQILKEKTLVRDFKIKVTPPGLDSASLAQRREEHGHGPHSCPSLVGSGPG